MENNMDEIKKKLSNTAKTADNAMTKIDDIYIAVDIARKTAVSRKDKTSEAEKQIKDLVLDYDTKFDKNIEKTTELKYMMNKLLSMYRNQQAPPEPNYLFLHLHNLLLTLYNPLLLIYHPLKITILLV